MKIRARIDNSRGKQEVTLETNGERHALAIPPKAGSPGSSVNGGELLFLALATCYCNDLYREAGKLQIHVSQVEVEVEGEFGREGEPARNITYHVRIKAAEGKERLKDLLDVTDRLAEIQNTLRAGVPVKLGRMEIESE